MVYDVQNYEVYFGLYPSSGKYDKKSQRFGDGYQTMDKVQNKPHSSVLKLEVYISFSSFSM
jgi:hypothetical protein